MVTDKDGQIGKDKTWAEKQKTALPKMEKLDHVGHFRLDSRIDGVGIDVGDILVDNGIER